MSLQHSYLALDLGAESGRAMLGQFDGQRLGLAEIHRFSNGPVRLSDGLHWDVLRLWGEVKKGIALSLREQGQNLVSLGIDTWGVDYGLLDRDGALISNPFHYRDSRTDGMLEEAFRRVPREEIFRQTGIQFLQLNSLYQLLSQVVNRSPALEIAHTFLTTPDLFNYWLTGERVCEFTNATTTQCFDPGLGRWAEDLLQRLDIPHHIFPSIVPPGTNLGPLTPHVAEDVGLDPRAALSVIAPACHDTGSAVAAVPAEAPGFAWISSGTWSVVGAEVAEPVITEKSLAHNFTNEGGVFDTYRFSKNVVGLWLVQECRRTWAHQGQDHSYSELADLAALAQPFMAVLDPDHAEFFKPGDMPERIRSFCTLTGQPVPHSKGEIVRCALEAIALKYRWVLERLEEMIGRRLEPLHIVGGGTQNRLLSRFTANATSQYVITGPVEATATGNILMQMIASGHIDSLADGRRIVRQSFPMATFEPDGTTGWQEAYERLLRIMEQLK